MSPDTEQLITAALELPDDDRLELIEALIASFPQSTDAPLDDSWRDVIRRRAAELESGQVTPIPWEEVKRQAREKLGG